MEIKTIKTRLFKVNEDLLAFLDQYLPTVQERTIVVIASKIVALAEGRIVPLVDGIAKAELIKQESQVAIPTKFVYLTVKDGVIMANAGIDESNANGQMVLLPQDSFKIAAIVRHYFQAKYQVKEFGVIITDSNCLPMRAGVIGIALGYAGLVGLKDYSGQADLFGRTFQFSKVDVADSLATAAALCMGEGDESQPLAIISQAPVEYCAEVNQNELKIVSQDDMYRPLLEDLYN